MNKNKMKKFFTLKHRSNEGFTLVELIVVIAILAILAGVSVPAYSGYIKRANEAKDQMLIAAVNEAFAGGCVEAGVEVADVTDASISVVDQKVFGVSDATTVAGVTNAQINSICSTFNLLFAGNFDTAFATENVLSLKWVPADNSFVMDHENSVASRVLLSSGKSFTVSPERMAQIEASTYAELGYGAVALIVDDLTGSSETLCSTAKTFGLLDRFTNAMDYNGLLAEDANTDDMTAEEAANGLQMVTAKYLAGADQEDIDYLLNEVSFENGTWSALTNIAEGKSGTEAVAAMALQYALVEAYANSDAANGQTVTYGTGEYDKKWVEDSSIPFVGGYYEVYEIQETVSVTDYLNSDIAKGDPLAALAAVQGTPGYTNYTTTEQYTNDVNGFVGTMSLLGDNLGTVQNPGAVDIDAFFQDGIHSQDAADALTAVLGE